MKADDLFERHGKEPGRVVVLEIPSTGEGEALEILQRLDFAASGNAGATESRSDRRHGREQSINGPAQAIELQRPELVARQRLSLWIPNHVAASASWRML
jgi:hypothetical protein